MLIAMILTFLFFLVCFVLHILYLRAFWGEKGQALRLILFLGLWIPLILIIVLDPILYAYLSLPFALLLEPWIEL